MTPYLLLPTAKPLLVSQMCPGNDVSLAQQLQGPHQITGIMPPIPPMNVERLAQERLMMAHWCQAMTYFEIEQLI
jgi:hypothetical protein